MTFPTSWGWQYLHHDAYVDIKAINSVRQNRITTAIICNDVAPKISTFDLDINSCVFASFPRNNNTKVQKKKTEARLIFASFFFFFWKYSETTKLLTVILMETVNFYDHKARRDANATSFFGLPFSHGSRVCSLFFCCGAEMFFFIFLY